MMIHRHEVSSEVTQFAVAATSNSVARLNVAVVIDEVTQLTT